LTTDEFYKLTNNKCTGQLQEKNLRENSQFTKLKAPCALMDLFI